MAFLEGFDPTRGPGRAKGTLNKKTELRNALITVYGGDGVTPFWEGVAQESDGTGPMAAACKKMIADRLSPTLKSVEVKADDGALQVIIQRFNDISPELPQSASTVGHPMLAPDAEKKQKVTEE